MKRVTFEYIEMFQLIRAIQRFCSTGLCAFYIASVFCSALTAIRVAYTGLLHYDFLIWNLFLAWLPYIFARRFSVEKNPRLKYALGILWLFFFPNAPYIITDFIHLENRQNTLFWFDLALLFSYSLTGLTLGLASLRRIHDWLRERLSFLQSWALVSAIIFVSAFGIYLGRELRFNSWDVISAPVELGTRTFETFRHTPLEALAFSLIFSALMFFCYLGFLLFRRRSFLQ